MLTRDELEALVRARDALGPLDAIPDEQLSGEAYEAVAALADLIDRLRARLWVAAAADGDALPELPKGEPDPTDVSASLAAGGHVVGAPERPDGWHKADERPMRSLGSLPELAAQAQAGDALRALRLLVNAASVVLAQGPTAGNLAELEAATEAAKRWAS